MRYRFVTCDVFTDRRFGGNQLAVLPEAEGLSPAWMQSIAAEFNYSETTFVVPPAEPAHRARVRIFTPKAEIPFAGHPTVGTALVLAWLGRTPAEGEFVLEEGAGSVPVRIAADGHGGAIAAEFAAPVAPSHGPTTPAEPVAAALGLSTVHLVTDAGLPCVASCGTPFLVVELAGRDALARARLDASADLPDGGNGVFLFTREPGDGLADVRARMFAPKHGIPEDPATGSAAAAFAGFLGGRPGLADGWHRWRIVQGVEMGRPSLIEASAHRRGSRVVEVRVGGKAVPVAEGTI
ncbi:MAG TPA: PhzF family phenazine biosynthesis protein, partial [Geminicoccaceae bacterium]|nr:PhzF family phenazine biosynthesis protein [Geminicoccaceae bacterium]